VITIDSVVLRPLVEAEVPARQLGVLARIDVNDGATVQTDDLLASMDDRAAELKVRQATVEAAQAEAKAKNKVSIEYAEKALEVAQAELKRSLESNEKFPDSISDSQLDVERLTVEKLILERQQAIHELLLAEFELELKAAALEAARLELELHRVRAPFSGLVALVRGRVGEWVQPGDAVVRLVAVDVLRAEGFAPAEVAARGLIGARARFKIRPADDEGAENPTGEPEGEIESYYEAPIAFVSPEVDPVSGQVRIWCDIDNRDRKLVPGQRGTLEVLIEQ
jgi:RND family efflux transporter MFP subunit